MKSELRTARPPLRSRALATVAVVVLSGAVAVSVLVQCTMAPRAPQALAVSNTEGGTGARAKGEQGHRRYAVQGPKDSPAAPQPQEERHARSSAEQSAVGGGGSTEGLGRGVGGLGGIGLGGGGLGHGAGQLGSGQGFGAGHGRLSGGVADFDTESYAALHEPGFTSVESDPRSTFSIDVDTASYSMVRRMLREGQRPPVGAVRIEEMLNYFSYAYPEPEADQPFSVVSELSAAPWQPKHKLLRLGIKARHIDTSQRPASNLVFLVDVSGSMQPEDKLPLLQRGLVLLAQQLRATDRVSLVVYAGASGVVLPSTPGDRRKEITAALDRLAAGGSTNGASGIQLAYAQARAGFIEGGINRVILATDGDFNVGLTSHSELVDLITRQAKTGVFLSVLGVGRGNYKDDTLEQLADKGNGNYAYVDSLAEARKVLVEQASGTLHTVAKDVKIQVEFNPARVAGFRLIGYENRKLAHGDFNDDRKDAGEIGADHTVTALYEIVPVGTELPGAKVDALTYQRPTEPTARAATGELLTVNLRYKPPSGDQSRRLTHIVADTAESFARASRDFRFASSVATFAMALRGSEHRGRAAAMRAAPN